MNKNMSRRDFLKLAGVTSAGLALSACGIDATKLPDPTATPMATFTPFPTATNTPAPTATATPKPPETLREYADALGIEIGGNQAIGYFQDWHDESAKMKPFFLENFNLFGNSWDCLWENPYEPLRPSKTTFDFEYMDLYAKFMRDNKLKGQALLIWGYKQHLPEWLLKGNFKETELLEILENHISTVVGRYKGKIQEYSVVNEILDNPWEKGNTFWYDHLDKNLDWVKKCFQWANQADPNAILLLNDFGIEFPGFFIYKKERDDFDYNLIRSIKESGTPIHGVAFQMHLNAFRNFYPDTNLSSLMDGLSKNIEKYQGLGIDVYVTEFDLVMAGLKQLTIDERYALQAKVYGSVLDTCLSAGVKSFTFFGLIDRLSWLDEKGGENPPYSGKDGDPCAWDDNYQPKPAYYAMMDVMKKHYQQRHS